MFQDASSGFPADFFSPYKILIDLLRLEKKPLTHQNSKTERISTSFIEYIPYIVC